MARKRNNEPLHLQVEELHEDGYCLTEDGKHGVFGALAGESVISIPIARKRKKLFSRVTEVECSSDDRVQPACAVADICGGCSLQHMSSEAQLIYKQQMLLAEFVETPPQQVLPPLSEDCYHYRSKARLGVKFVEKKDRVLVGFREVMKPYIVQMNACYTLREPVANLIEPLQLLVGELSEPTAIPQIEVAIGDELSALVFRHLQPLSHQDFERLKAFAEQYNVQLYLQPGGPDSVHKIWPADENLRLEYFLPEYDISMSFHPLDFTQINAAINRKMIPLALGLLELDENDHVLDAFCGIGNFSLAIARGAKSVLGMESVEASVIRARENATLNNIDNADFLVVDLFTPQLPEFVLGNVNKVLVDPPRTGALELCKKLASDKVERLVYVSCNPKTLARDAQILVESGYQLQQLGIIDMFPHTTHVESIALFTLN